MKNTDNIEKLFKETFENFEADVNPKVWANVQNGINSVAGSATSTAAKFAIGKIIASAAAVAGIAGSVWYFTSNSNTQTNSSSSGKNDQTETVSKETAQNIISENKPEGNNSNTQTNKQTASPVHPSSSSAVSNHQTQNASDVSGNEINSSGDNSGKSNSSSQTEHKYGNATQGDGGIMRYNKYINNNTSAAKENSSDETESTDESADNTNPETEAEQNTAAETKPVSGISNVANVFTPNGDGFYDYFHFDFKNIANIGVAIYSQKTGELVAKWNSLDGSWNGKLMNGTDAPIGVYFYSIQAMGTDGVSHYERGSVTLSR